MEVRAVAKNRRNGERGFTLVELIVVVIIIAVLAVLAIPTITSQLRSRRTQFAAKEVASIYRTARMRAMGRGSAVLVRFENDVTIEGRVEMREAVRFGNVNADCDRMPVSNCQLTNWQAASPNNQLISTFTSFKRSELQDIRVAAIGAPPVNASAQSQMDVCFTPMGRTFIRYNQGVPFTPLTGVPTLQVFRFDPGLGQPYGIIRTVMILPTGNVRLGAAEAPP